VKFARDEQVVEMTWLPSNCPITVQCPTQSVDMFEVIAADYYRISAAEALLTPTAAAA